MTTRRVLAVVLVCASCLGADVYQDMIYKSARANGGAAGAVLANAVMVDTPGMGEAQRTTIQFSSNRCRTTGDYSVTEPGWAFTANLGRIAPRAGSVTAIKSRGVITVTSGNINCSTVVYINGSSQWSVNSGNQTATGTYTWPAVGSDTAARATYALAAGDRVVVRCNQEISVGVGTCGNWNSDVEVTWDN